VKVEAAECSACVAELPPAIPTSDEPMQPADALDAGVDAYVPVDGPSMELFDGLPDLDSSLPFTGTKDENGRKRSKTDLRYRKTKTIGSGYFYI
jgi:hypothetical protein